ncbi:MAG: hypothetical protein QM811_03015 [Pirellulales bacterium]
MSSPFELIRNNQKVLLPVIGIGCMLAFTVGAYVTQIFATKGQERAMQRAEERIVGTWDGGRIDVAELRAEVRQQGMLTQLLSEMAFSLRYGQISLEQFPEQFRQQLIGSVFSQTQQMLNAPQTETQAFQGKLLEKLGGDLGIVITDKQVNEFMESFRVLPEMGTDGKPTQKALRQITRAEMTQMIENLTRVNPTFTENSVFEMLRQALLRNRTMQVVGLYSTMQGEPPLARFDSYNMLHRRAQVQVIPVKVDDFVAQVKDPTDDQLKTFFAAHKDALPNPDSAEVGLRTPDRVTLQVFTVNDETLVDGLKPKISNKEIADYYEKNKDQFYRKGKLPPVPGEEKPAPTTDESKSDETKSGDAKTDESKSDTSKSDAAKTDAGKAADGKSGDAKATDAKTEEPKVEPAKSVEPTPPAPAKEPAKAPAAKQSSLDRMRMTPVAFQADAKKDESKKEAAKTEPAKAEPTKSDAKTEPAADPAKSEASKSEPVKSDPAAATEPPQTKIPAPLTVPEPVEYKTLESVQDEIRETLAREQANAKITTWMTKLTDEMNAYNNQRMRAASESADSSKLKFDPFDLKKAAAAVDPAIQAEELTLITYGDLMKHPLSTANVTLRQRNFAVPQIVFDEQAFPTFYPFQAPGLTGRRLFWKTEHAKEEVPTLSDPKTRERAILVWKTVEARKLAMAEAERFAKIANEAKKPLVELAKEKILPTAMDLGEFSWMTQGLAAPNREAPPPQLTRVSGLDKIGDPFMATLFGLSKDQAATAWNTPQSIVYVVQPVKIDALDSKRAEFLASLKTDAGRNESFAAGIPRLAEEERVFIENLQKRYNVKLNRSIASVARILGRQREE